MRLLKPMRSFMRPFLTDCAVHSRMFATQTRRSLASRAVHDAFVCDAGTYLNGSKVACR